LQSVYALLTGIVVYEWHLMVSLAILATVIINLYFKTATNRNSYRIYNVNVRSGSFKAEQKSFM